MTTSILRTVGPVLLACASMIAVVQSAWAGADAFFVAPTSNAAPSYESDYAAAARRAGHGQSTPEADARPGEYYYLLGAEAFRKREYVFAIQMYEVAASWAFKPAEYNLGVMYSRGQGVPIDMPRAMAWMALAAERNDEHYVEAREAVYAELSKEQFDQANVIWRDLKKTYGDEVAMRRAKARWAEVRNNMTGSKVGSGATPMTVGVPNANGGDPSFPKVGSDALKAAMQKNGMVMAQSSATSPAEATGGQGTDASIAYRQLRESDNPYDPKFERGAIGIATVGEPTAVKDKAPKDAAADPDSGKPER